MLKHVLYNVFLFFAIAQAFIQPLIYIEYSIRKEYIVAELCKERYATINTCDGRCFLVKKLNQAQQHESEQKERNIRPLELNLKTTEIYVFQFSPHETITSMLIPSRPTGRYSYLTDKSLEKPPQA